MSSSAALKEEPVKLMDTRSLRDAFGSFATGITIITAEMDGKPIGKTVNSFSSVSLEPPLVSWCIDNKSKLYPFFTQTKFFSINILGKDQQEVSNIFTNNGGDGYEQKKWRTGIHGAPLLADSIACFQCQTEHLYPGGDHTIIVGRVLEFFSEPAAPLVFYGGKYYSLST